MDRNLRHELDNLLQGYKAAVEEVDRAEDDDARVKAWRKLQTLGWRLHELLPSVMDSLPA